MKLTLNQEEIEVALKQYVGNNVSFKAGSDISIEFTAGRGANGLTAEIDIPYLGVSSIPAAAAQPAVTKRAEKETAAKDAEPVNRSEPETVASEGNTDDDAPAAEEAQDEAAPTTSGKSLFGQD